MMRKLGLAFALATLPVTGIAFAPVALAQSGQGNLCGTVTEASGSVLPGSRVTLRGGNGRDRTVSTDQDGQYCFGQVPAGSYTLTIEAAAFKTARFNLSVDAGRNVRQDATLEIAAVSETVVVD
jgi:hypothetical protein